MQDDKDINLSEFSELVPAGYIFPPRIPVVEEVRSPALAGIGYTYSPGFKDTSAPLPEGVCIWVRPEDFDLLQAPSL